LIQFDLGLLVAPWESLWWTAYPMLARSMVDPLAHSLPEPRYTVEALPMQTVAVIIGVH
jgi:hypothetical protein